MRGPLNRGPLKVPMVKGMVSSLEPGFNVLDVAYPLLRAHQLLGDDVFSEGYKWGQH